MTIEAKVELAPEELKEGMVVEMLGISEAGLAARPPAVRFRGWEGRPAEVLDVDRCWVWLEADFGSAGIKKQYFAKDHYDFAREKYEERVGCRFCGKWFTSKHGSVPEGICDECADKEGGS